ncbi:MAG: peptide ABC transporter substrate-binding protein [Thioalkalispiraceae bacterium]|jgi:oligopeptide transport system substrate-binding protein
MINGSLKSLAFLILCVCCIQSSTTDTHAAQLAAEQILHRGNGSEPQSLDPHKSEGVPSANIQRDLYEGLVSEAPNGDLVPGVASDWTISRDGRRYIFSLRKNARWSNGEAVTAHDFVYSWRRIVNPQTGSYYSQTLSPVLNAEQIIKGEKKVTELGVNALGDHKLEVNLKGPTPYFLGLLTHSSTYPVHRKSIEKHGDRFARAGNLIGNGAFVLKEWAIQSHILLEPNPFYWDNQNTKLEKVYYYPIEDQSSELKRYRAGEIDIAENVPISQMPWLRKNLQQDLHVAPYLGIYYFGYNLTRPPFKAKPQLRQALSMVIDRKILTEKILRTGETPAYSWVPPGVANYQPVEYHWKDWPMDKRIEHAQELYRQAGYSKNKPLDVEIRYNTSENHKKVAIVIASMWKRHLGVNTALYNEEWKVFLANRKAKQKTQVFRSGWIADYNDAFSFAELLHSQHGVNDTGYNNPEYDALLEKSAIESDKQKRETLLRQAEALVLEDYPVIPIYYYMSKHLVKPYVGGYQDNIMDHHYSKHLYIKAH